MKGGGDSSPSPSVGKTLQETAVLFTFTEEILNGNFIFCEMIVLFNPLVPAVY